MNVDSISNSNQKNVYYISEKEISYDPARDQKVIQYFSPVIDMHDYTDIVRYNKDEDCWIMQIYICSMNSTHYTLFGWADFIDRHCKDELVKELLIKYISKTIMFGKKDGKAKGALIEYKIPYERVSEAQHVLLAMDELQSNDEVIKEIGGFIKKYKMNWNQKNIENDLKFKYELIGLPLSICCINIKDIKNSIYVTEYIMSKFNFKKGEFKWKRTFCNNIRQFTPKIIIESKEELNLQWDADDNFEINLELKGITLMRKIKIRRQRQKNYNNEDDGNDIFENNPILTDFMKTVNEIKRT